MKTIAARTDGNDIMCTKSSVNYVPLVSRRVPSGDTSWWPTFSQPNNEGYRSPRIGGWTSNQLRLFTWAVWLFPLSSATDKKLDGAVLLMFLLPSIGRILQQKVRGVLWKQVKAEQGLGLPTKGIANQT